MLNMHILIYLVFKFLTVKSPTSVTVSVEWPLNQTLSQNRGLTLKCC